MVVVVVMTIIDRGGIEVVVGLVVVIVLVEMEVVVVIVSLTPMVVIVVILVDACGHGSCHRLQWWWNHIAGVWLASRSLWLFSLTSVVVVMDPWLSSIVVVGWRWWWSTS